MSGTEEQKPQADCWLVFNGVIMKKTDKNDGWGVVLQEETDQTNKNKLRAIIKQKLDFGIFWVRNQHGTRQ